MKNKKQNKKNRAGAMFAMLNHVQNLRDQRTALEQKIEDIDARIADIQLDWNDLQKEISLSIFGTASAVPAPTKGVVKRGERRPEKKRRVTKKKATARVSKGATSGIPTKKKATRDDIRARAKARDQKLIAVLREARAPMSVHELHRAVANGNLEQMKTALSRVRNLIVRTGYAKKSRYQLKKGK